MNTIANPHPDDNTISEEDEEGEDNGDSLDNNDAVDGLPPPSPATESHSDASSGTEAELPRKLSSADDDREDEEDLFENPVSMTVAQLAPLSSISEVSLHNDQVPDVHGLQPAPSAGRSSSANP